MIWTPIKPAKAPTKLAKQILSTRTWESKDGMVYATVSVKVGMMKMQGKKKPVKVEYVVWRARVNGRTVSSGALPSTRIGPVDAMNLIKQRVNGAMKHLENAKTLRTEDFDAHTANA